METLVKIVVTILLTYVLSLIIMRSSSLVRDAVARAYHAIAGRGVPDPDLTCEIDTTDGTAGRALRILVGRAVGCTLSTGEVREQAASMLKDADKLATRIAKMEQPGEAVRVLTFEYPAELSLRTRGVYLDKAHRVWAASEDGARLAVTGYNTLAHYDGQGRWCIEYVVPKDHTPKERA